LFAAFAGTDGLFLEPRNLVAERLNIHLARLPEAFRSFRIAQISDVHFGPYMGKPGLERALRLAQSFQPDLLALTGDFVSHPFGKSYGVQGAHYAEPCADVLATVRNIPLLAILGNHDHWNNGKIVAGALNDRGITVLRNRAVPLERGGRRIWICGVDDALVRAADLEKALRGVPASETTVLLAHEPDFADYASASRWTCSSPGILTAARSNCPVLGPWSCPRWRINIRRD
jgi:uncharacterized protein